MAIDIRHFGVISGVDTEKVREGLQSLLVPQRTALLVFQSIKDAVEQINSRCNDAFGKPQVLSVEELPQGKIMRITASFAALQEVSSRHLSDLQDVSVMLQMLTKIAEDTARLIREPHLSVSPEPRKLIHIDNEKGEIAIDIMDWTQLHRKIVEDTRVEVPAPIPQFGETPISEIVRMALQGERPVSLFLEGNEKNFTYFHGYKNQTALDSYMHDVVHIYAFAPFGGTEYLKAAGLFAYRTNEVLSELGFARDEKGPIEEQIMDILEGCTMCRSFTPVKDDSPKPGVQAVVADAFNATLNHLTEDRKKQFVDTLSAKLRDCRVGSTLWGA